MTATNTKYEQPTYADTVGFTGSPPISITNVPPTGLTGATAASRYVGATTGGPPTSGGFNTGDWVIDRTGPIWVCTSGGSPGTWVPIPINLAAYNEPFIAGSSTPPVAVTLPRGTGQATITPTSGTAIYRGVPLLAGQVISNISVLSVGAESGGSHAWVALADTGAVVRAVSADNTGATFFAANTAKTIALGSSYTVPSTGLYFVVLGVTATGVPTFVGGLALATGQSGMGLGQPLCGTAGAFGAPPTVTTALTLSAVAANNLYAVLT